MVNDNIAFKAALELERRKRARLKMKSSLREFLVQDGEGNYQVGRHLEYLIDKLEKFTKDVQEGKSPRMIVCMPPRHGKSETVTKKFPAWALGNNPMWEVIISSYSADLSEDFSRICRDTFEKHQDIFGLKLSKDSSSVKNWGIEGYRGRLTATGVGGAATGKGAHIAIVDDPIKNRQDAQSETKRKTMLDWYRSTLRTRLAPGGGVIIVQTRWHDEDLAGYLLKEMEKETGEVFDLINFPALAEEDDILGREIGEVLWPERYSREELEKIEKAIGSIEWNALYQQRPSAENGEIFKRQYFKYFSMISNEYLEYEDELGIHKVNIKDLLIFQTIDTALKINKVNDSTAIGTWGASRDGNLFLLDLFLKKLEVPDQWPLIKEMKRKWNPLFQAVEDKQSGTGIIQQAKREFIPIKPLKAENDKVTRSIPFSIMVENGKVYFNSKMPQLFEFEEQLIKFPNAAHDDAVDVCSYAGIVVQNGRFGAGGGNRVSMKAKVISF